MEGDLGVLGPLVALAIVVSIAMCLLGGRGEQRQCLRWESETTLQPLFDERGTITMWFPVEATRCVEYGR